MSQVVKNPPASAGDTGDTGSIPRSGRFPGSRARHPTPVFLLGESTDRGAWWATVMGYSFTDSQTLLGDGACTDTHSLATH